jgi:L-alanine-DL-glutamate epimerase-like enolase superfamily enzyme
MVDGRRRRSAADVGDWKWGHGVHIRATSAVAVDEVTGIIPVRQAGAARFASGRLEMRQGNRERGRVRVRAEARVYRMARPFKISGQTNDTADLIEVEVEEDGVRGRGEANGVDYLGESPASMLAQIEAVRSTLERGVSRQALQALLPRGGARNAVDCALWDLEARGSGMSAAHRAGLKTLAPVRTAHTVVLDRPEIMAEQACAFDRGLIKMKLGATGDESRIRAVRAAAPQADLIADANQGWSAAEFARLLPVLAEAGVLLIEQPLAIGGDAALASLRSPIPVCADESCQDRADLAALCDRYQAINIKLDKTGGLTEAFALADAARAAGLLVMVGCMFGSSLAACAGLLIAQQARFVDMDCAALLAEDLPGGVRYAGDRLYPASAGFWG